MINRKLPGARGLSGLAWGIAFLLAAGMVMAGGAADAQIAQRAVVYIETTCMDPEKGATPIPPQGTGVVITRDGFLLTAAHVVSCVIGGKKLKRIKTEGILGHNKGPRLPIDVRGMNVERDVAILQFAGPTGDYAHVKSCRLRDIPTGKPFVAYGYPFGQRFQPVSGIFGVVAENGQWGNASSVDRGMSGAPVLVDGHVVGLVASGVPGVNALRRVTPLHLSNSAISDVLAADLPVCNTPSSLAKGESCEDTLRRADVEISQRNFYTARDFYNQAETVCSSDDYRPLSGQGLAFFRLAKYGDSVSYFRKAYEVARNSAVSSALISRLLISKGYALEGLGDYDRALGVFRRAKEGFDISSREFYSADFSVGRMLLTQWIDKGHPKNSSEHRDALQVFNRFLRSGHSPTRWAKYNIACLSAQDRANESAVESLLSAVIYDISSDVSVNSEIQKNIMRRLIRNPESSLRIATQPVPCPLFKKFFDSCDCKQNLSDMLD